VVYPSKRNHLDIFSGKKITAVTTVSDVIFVSSVSRANIYVDHCTESSAVAYLRIKSVVNVTLGI